MFTRKFKVLAQKCCNSIFCKLERKKNWITYAKFYKLLSENLKVIGLIHFVYHEIVIFTKYNSNIKQFPGLQSYIRFEPKRQQWHDTYRLVSKVTNTAV